MRLPAAGQRVARRPDAQRWAEPTSTHPSRAGLRVLGELLLRAARVAMDGKQVTVPRGGVCVHLRLHAPWPAATPNYSSECYVLLLLDVRVVYQWDIALRTGRRKKEKERERKRERERERERERRAAIAATRTNEREQPQREKNKIDREAEERNVCRVIQRVRTLPPSRIVRLH